MKHSRLTATWQAGLGQAKSAGRRLAADAGTQQTFPASRALRETLLRALGWESSAEQTWVMTIFSSFLSPVRSMAIWLTLFLRLLWASPNSLLGILCGLCGLLSGGKMQWRHGCLEFYGGLVSWGLARTPIAATAMTLGHTILGRDALALEQARAHEHVHVRQYATWGPLFLPAYLGCAALLWLGGKHPYWDNPFEREAYRLVPGPTPRR